MDSFLERLKLERLELLFLLDTKKDSKKIENLLAINNSFKNMIIKEFEIQHKKQSRNIQLKLNFK